MPTDPFFEEGSRVLTPHAFEFVLDAELDRLAQWIDSYDFPAPLRVSMGAACYPTHAVDSRLLKKRVRTQPAVCWRSEPENHS